MPVIRGKPKEQISYKCPHDLLLKINTAVETGRFASRNDLITAALRQFFDNAGADTGRKITAWMESDEGEEYIANLIRRNLKAMKEE